MKRLAYIFLIQAFLCAGVSFAWCPAVPTSTSGGAIHVEVDFSASGSPGSKLSISYHSRSNVVDLGVSELSDIAESDDSELTALATWRNERGEVVSQTRLRTFYNGGKIIFRGDVYDCSNNLIGSYRRVSSILGEGDVVSYIYDAWGREIARSLPGKDRAKLIAVQSNGLDQFLVERRESYHRILSIAAGTNTLDVRLILAFAANYSE